MERRGIETEVAQRVREQQRQEAEHRLERAAEAGRLEREARELERSILDLDTTLRAALRERDQARDFLAGARQEGREALADLRRRAALEREKGLERERTRGLDRDGPDFER